MSQATTAQLPYPGNGATKDARAWLAHKVGIDPFGVGFLANPDLVLRAAIENYGETVIAGTAPNGRVETVAQLYDRTIAPWNATKVKRKPAGKPHRKGPR